MYFNVTLRLIFQDQVTNNGNDDMQCACYTTQAEDHKHIGVAVVSYIIYTRAKCSIELPYLPFIHLTVL